MTNKSPVPSDDEIWTHYNGLLLSHDTDRVRKLVVRYELFRRAMQVPGDILEFGVFKGVGLMYWLKLLSIFEPAAQRRVVGFDTFGAFADSLLDYERKSAGAFVSEADFQGTEPSDLMALAEAMGEGKRLELVAGDVIETAPQYVKENPGFRIALLHLDLDTYHGTKAALEALYDHVVPGGLIVLDEYGKRGWGESDAVDEFIKDRGLALEAVEQGFQPSALIEKPLS